MRGADAFNSEPFSSCNENRSKRSAMSSGMKLGIFCCGYFPTLSPRYGISKFASAFRDTVCERSATDMPNACRSSANTLEMTAVRQPRAHNNKITRIYSCLPVFPYNSVRWLVKQDIPGYSRKDELVCSPRFSFSYLKDKTRQNLKPCPLRNQLTCGLRKAPVHLFSEEHVPASPVRLS